MPAIRGRGPQVMLEGYARTVARGGVGKTMRDNIAAMDVLISAGLVADGSTVDGSSRSGGQPYDAVVAQFPHEPLSAWEIPAPLLQGLGGSSGVGGVNVLDFGAVADGVDTGTAFTGWDNTAAFQAALDHAGSLKLLLFVPPGVYRFSGVTVDDTAVLTLPSYCWITGPGATFLVDENTSIAGASLRDFMRSTGWGVSMDRTLNQFLRIDGVTWQGRWSHVPMSSVSNKGIAFLAAANYREVILDGVRAFDCRSNFSRCRANDAVSVTGSHFERICSDTIRFTDSPNCLIDGNYVKETGDNSISLHSSPMAVPTAPYINRPTRAGLVVTNNRLVQCIAPVILGAHTIVFANNIMERCLGGVAIGLALPPEGTNTQANLSIHGNINENDLQRWAAVAGGGSFPAQLRSSGVMTVGGMPATSYSSPVAPGEYNAGSVLSLWGTSPTPIWGYLHTGNNAAIAGTLQQSTAGSVNISVSDNVIARTLPDVAHYSDWGFGQLFASTGYVNPPIDVNSFRLAGLVLSSDMRNFIVADNIISGMVGGAGIFLTVPSTEVMTANMFLGGVIRGNIVKDCQFGVTTTFSGDLATPARSVEMLIESNYFDIDPYFRSSFRTSPIDGTWPSSGATSDFPCGINTQGWNGFVIRGNVFANVYIPLGPTLPTAALAVPHRGQRLRL